MSIGGWAPIEGIIAKLREMAHAERGDWLRLSHQIELLQPVKAGSPAPAELQLTAAAAKRVAQQMPHAHVVNEDEFRGVAQGLATILKNGMDHCISKTDDRSRPFYLRGER
jgi:hypothetical protein